MSVSWDDAWMDVAFAVSSRSSCTRMRVGAVIVDPHNRIIATGYNGAPAGLRLKCADACERARKTDQLSPCYDDCISIHAEANALMFCDRRDREGGTIYVTTSMCYTCAKLVANSGLSRVVLHPQTGDEYRNPSRSMHLLESCGLKVEIHDTR